MRARAAHAARFVLATALRLVGTLALCVLALVLHLPGRVGRLALRDLARQSLATWVPGTASLGAVEVFTPGHIRLTGLAWRDLRGDPVIAQTTLDLRHAWRVVPALTRAAPLPELHLHVAEAWARVPALPPPDPVDPNAPEPPPPDFTVIAPSLVVQIDRVHSALEGLPGEARDLHLDGSATYSPGGLSADVHAFRGVVTHPTVGTHRVALDGRLSTLPPGRVEAHLAITGDTLRCAVHARSDREGHVAATFDDCLVPEGALNRALRRPADAPLPAEIHLERAHAEGTLDGEWELTATLAVDRQRADLHAAFGRWHQRVELAVHDLGFQRVAPWLPAGHLEGVLALDRWQDGAAHRLVLDASRIEGDVLGVPLPPLRAEAHIEGQRIRLDSLQVPELDLTARGTYDGTHRAPTFHAEVDLDSPDLVDIPWVRRRLHGRIRLHARGDALDGRIRAEAGATVTGFQVAGLRVGSGTVTARVRDEDPLEDLDVTARVRGLSMGALGPFDADATVTGDPRRTLQTQLHVTGDGLSAQLPPLPRGARGGPSTVGLRAAINLSDPTRLRVDVSQGQLVLRGAQASLEGRVDMPRGADGADPLRDVSAQLRIATPSHGRLALGLQRGALDAQLEAFDLLWLSPLLGATGVGGQIAGRIRLDPGRPSASGGSLAWHHGSVGRMHDLEATLSLDRDPTRPRVGAMRVQLGVQAPRGTTAAQGIARIDVEAGLRPPRNLTRAQGWFDGLDNARVSLSHVDLGSFREFVPTGIALQGRLDAGLHVDRATVGGPLRLRATLEGREATAGIDLGLGARRRMSPAVVPMHLRAAVCTELTGPRLDAPPITLRVALGPDRGEAEVAPPDRCDAESPLLSAPLAALSGTLSGPWTRALAAFSRDLARPAFAPGDDTRALLAATTTDATLSLGPLRRSDWPLRTVPLRAANGTVTLLRPPDVPPETQLSGNLHVHGPLLGLETDVELEASTPSLPMVGFDEPISVRAFGAVSPAQGENLFGTVNLQLGLLGEISPSLPRPEQGRVEADLRVTGSLQSLRAEGVDGLRVRRFDINTDNIRMERIAWARQRGLRGGLDLDVNATDDARRPISARVGVRDLRSETVDPAGRRSETPTVHSAGNVTLVRGDAGWQLRGCLLSSLAQRASSVTAASHDCDPLAPRAAGAGALAAHFTLPLRGEGALTALRPRVADAEAELSARGFALETLSPFVPDTYATNLGGDVEAFLRWRGTERNVVRGRLAIQRGRVTVTSIGEPMRDLDFALVADGPELRIERARFALGRGRMDLTGNARLGEDVLARVSLRGEATDLPVVSAGNTWGWMHGVVRLGLNVRADATEGTLDLDTARVLVQEQPARDLQPLDDDPDIFVFGRTTLARPQIGGAYPVRIAYRTHTPVWLRRSDFTLAMTAQGVFVRDRAGNAVAGTLELASTQCWFSVFGKRFDFDRLRVSLDGNVNFNPELDIAAHYDSPTAGRIALTVSGRFSAPSVVFRAERYPTASQAEVLAMIVIGRSQGTTSTGQSDLASQAGAAVGSLLTGLTLGAFTSSLSREFSFLPTLIVEPGTGASRGRYGAGVNLSPRIYLQATYGAAAAAVGQTSAAVAEELRLLLEYAITESLTGSATWGTPSNRWGVDVFWSP
jgi:hypothetical protein